jgi:hypothetical protein
MYVPYHCMMTDEKRSISRDKDVGFVKVNSKLYSRQSREVLLRSKVSCRSPHYVQADETVYLKQNMTTAKAALPGASHGEVMRALSARWTEAGPEADHEAHWKAVLAATRG